MVVAEFIVSSHVVTNSFVPVVADKADLGMNKFVTTRRSH